jgi:glyoxylate reductase
VARPKVYVTRRIPREALDMLDAACDVRAWEEEEVAVPRDVLRRELSEADGVLTLLTERVDAELLAGAPRLVMVANMAVGYDNIDLAACTARRVMASNTPDVLTETTADLVWALLMATARRLVEAQKVVERDEWRSWSPMMLAGQDVHGATLGVIGAGRIGKAVIRRATGFGMRILYHNRAPDAQLEAETGARFVTQEELLAEADYVVPMVPLTPETRHLIDERALGQMKPTAILINVSRGPVVDERALEQALERRQLWAAGLDVWETEPIRSDHPLLRFPNVVALPHIASASVATRTRMATLAAENLIAGVTGKRPPTLLNPEAAGPEAAGPEATGRAATGSDSD